MKTRIKEALRDAFERGVDPKFFTAVLEYAEAVDAHVERLEAAIKEMEARKLLAEKTEGP